MSDSPADLPQEPLAQLLQIMARLRSPVDGCAWDLEQTFATIAPYTVEEAYEVADAIQRGDLEDLRDELGDLLFQVVFHSRMAEEAGAFAFDDVARAINQKMIRRHPHVFGAAEARTSDEQTVAWEVIKAAERGDSCRRSRWSPGRTAGSVPGRETDRPRRQGWFRLAGYGQGAGEAGRRGR